MTSKDCVAVEELRLRWPEVSEWDCVLHSVLLLLVRGKGSGGSQIAKFIRHTARYLLTIARLSPNRRYEVCMKYEV